MVKDEAGTSYDVEMQVANQYNLPKRMRYYQAVLDIAFLDKGYSYKALNNSVIIFVCLFDPIGNNRAIYTFENICREDKTIPLQDGTKKIILNAKAFKETMLTMGYPLNDICKISGLSQAEVEAL